jgi:molybdopterin converting factor small subunit
VSDNTGEVHVRLPAALVPLYPDAPRHVTMRAGSVEEIMDGLEQRWPGMRACLCDETPAIRRHINVFVGGRRVKLDTRLAPGADVYILTAVSGG